MLRVTSASRRFLLLIAFGLLATACAGARPTLEEEGAARQVDTVDESGAVDADGDGPSDEIEAREPIVLRLGVGTGWSGDPADAGPASLITRVLADLLHEGLTALNRDGSIGPGLAERWFVTEDRLTWTFVFAEGLTDGAGDALSARDMMHSLEAVARRGPLDQAATSLTMISGWTAHMTGEAGGVAGISAPNDTTLVIELDRPYELLVDVLAAPAFGINGTDTDGTIRTTGAYRYTGDPDVLAAVDPDALVATIELVRFEANAADLLADNAVDWVVLAPGEGGDELPGDIIRQPLDLRVGVAVRLADADLRRALLSAIDPVFATESVDSLDGLINPVAAEAPAGLPDQVTVDAPEGLLAPVGAALATEFEQLGLEVVLIESSVGEFASRIASGEALIFPVVMAGGSAGGESSLRVSTPGGVDDVLGSNSDDRAELVWAIGAELNAARRALLIETLEAALLDEGLLLPIGRFEVRIGIGPDMDGLRHRSDGTLDLSQLG